jgi:hypothetical protein
MKLLLRHIGKERQKKSTIGKLNVKYIGKIEFPRKETFIIIS